jgi:hypothetical protein
MGTLARTDLVIYPIPGGVYMSALRADAKPATTARRTQVCPAPLSLPTSSHPARRQGSGIRHTASNVSLTVALGRAGRMTQS